MRATGLLLVVLLLPLARPSVVSAQAPTGASEQAPAATSAEDLRAIAKEIIEGPEYRRQMRGQERVGLASRLWSRFIRWLAELLGRPLLESLQQQNPLAYWTIVGLLIGVLLLVLIHFALTLRLALRGEGDKGEDAAAPETGGIPRARELLAGAERAAASGRHREAIRLLYLALLSRLDRQGLISYDQTKTNWECLGATRSIPALHRPFGQLTAIFDRKWYGLEPAGARDYSFCRQLWDQAAARDVPSETGHGSEAAAGGAG